MRNSIKYCSSKVYKDNPKKKISSARRLLWVKKKIGVTRCFFSCISVSQKTATRCIYSIYGRWKLLLKGLDGCIISEFLVNMYIVLLNCDILCIKCIDYVSKKTSTWFGALTTQNLCVISPEYIIEKFVYKTSVWCHVFDSQVCWDD